jgi:predicted permease
MKRLTQLYKMIQALFHKGKLEERLSEELRFHLDCEIEKNLQAGLNPEEARYAALREFGGVEQTKEKCRDTWGLQWIYDLIKDIDYSLRLLRKTPVFTFVAILSLALGIGANTAIFSLWDVLFYKDLPVQNPAQIYQLWWHTKHSTYSNLDYSFFELLQKNSPSHSSFMAFDTETFNLRWAGETERISGMVVSGGYYSTLGVQAHLGRLILPEDDQRSNPHTVAVISHDLWVQRYGMNPNIIGKQLMLDGRSYTIVGVTPSYFFGVVIGEAPAVTIPMTSTAQFEGREVQVMSRISNREEQERTRAYCDLVYRQYLVIHANEFSRYPEDSQRAIFSTKTLIKPANKGMAFVSYFYEKPLPTLLLMVGTLLLIACVNLAGLHLARSATRRKEIGIRLALGATRFRLIRQMLIESTLLSLLGGMAGLLFALWGHRLLLTYLPLGSIPEHMKFHLDYPVLLFAFCLSLISGLLFGILPALKASAINLSASLKSENQQTLRASSLFAWGKILVAGQIGLSLTLLVCAALLARSLLKLSQVELGFSRQNILMVSVDPNSAGYKAEQMRALLQRLLDQLNSLPGIQSASVCATVSFGTGWWHDIWVQGHSYAPDENHMVGGKPIGPHFFRTLGLPLLLGQDFRREDFLERAPRVAIVNESFVRKYFPGQNPLGHRFGSKGPQSAGEIEIIGVVKDHKYLTLREETTIVEYEPFFMWGAEPRPLTLHIRTGIEPLKMVSTIRHEIHSIDSNLSIYDIKTMETQIDQSVVMERLLSTLGAFFGLLAILLAMIGLYGVLSYSVQQRYKEISIRMAVGAQQWNIIAMVLKESGWVILLGFLGGIPAGLASMRLFRTFLFGVTPADPASLVIALLLLSVIGLTASFVPARKAALTAPMTFLKCE